MRRHTLVLAVVWAATGACTAFSADPGPSVTPPPGGDAAIDALPSPSSDAAATFCGEHREALFCDDFESANLDPWSEHELDLGTVDVVDAASVGRSGKVLHFAITKGGAANESLLRIRKLIGPAGPLRVAFDLRLTEWARPSGLSNMLGGSVVLGGLRTRLFVTSQSQGLTLLANTDDSTFYRVMGEDAHLHAPVGKWEHYEVVVGIPDDGGTSTRFGWFVGPPPGVGVVEESANVVFASSPRFAPAAVELGFERPNDGPMPIFEAYYDNVVVTRP